MNNVSLKNDLNEILEKSNDLVIEKGSIGGNSISIYSEKPIYEDFGTYTYYANEANRDADFDALQSLIKEKNEQ
jgi:hypothetical protein